jgi:flagellar biogenesis protein FliO
MGNEKSVAKIRENYLRRALHRLKALGRGWGSHPSRQLRLSETLALGERRFVAVIEFEQQKFLIGGTGNSVAMLSPLPGLEIAKPNPAAALRDKEKVRQNGGIYEEIPTWSFAGAGPVVEMVRR